MQNSSSKFHHFLFQFFKFTFCHFSLLSFNLSQFNPLLTVHLLVPSNCSKWCCVGLNLIFNIYLFLNLLKKKNPEIRGRWDTDRRIKRGCCYPRLLSYKSTCIFLHHQSKQTNKHRLIKLNHPTKKKKKFFENFSGWSSRKWRWPLILNLCHWD